MTEKDTDCYNIINMFPDSDAVLCFNQSVPLNDPLFFPAASSAGFFCVCFALPFSAYVSLSRYVPVLLWPHKSLGRGSL